VNALHACQKWNKSNKILLAFSNKKCYSCEHRGICEEFIVSEYVYDGESGVAAMRIGIYCITLVLLITIQSFTVKAQDNSDLYGKGLDKVTRGDYYGAISDFTKVIEQQGREPKPYYYRGISKYNLKDYSNAIWDFTMAIECNQKFADAFYMRGMAKVALKKRKEACEDFKLAAKYGNANASYALDKYCN
jgi:TolA-binding protein